MVKVLSAVFLLFFIFTAEASAQMIINEFIPNPVGDDGGGHEWVEFINSGSQDVDLSEYYFDDDNNFDDDSGLSGKIQLSGILTPDSLCFLSLSSYLNNNGDNPTLFKVDKSIIDNYAYSSSSEGKSFSRVPDGGAWQSNQEPSKVATSCQSLVASPTVTPTNTPGPTSAPSATLRVKEVKNEDGELLSNVKIYIDSVYTHHFAPEDINFCESCKCDGCEK